MTAQELAIACAEAMWREDQASPGLGMVLDQVAPGAARVSMVVEARMLNGHRTCHGGLIFALADSAFGFACNTDGMAAVASHCSITFLRPVLLGETLVATAQERQTEGRTGIYDVRVSVGDGVVAEFRGMSRTTGRRWAGGVGHPGAGSGAGQDGAGRGAGHDGAGRGAGHDAA